MMREDGGIAVIVGAIVAAAGYLWGGWDAMTIALAALVVLDYVTAVLAACSANEPGISSDVGRRGIMKKLGLAAAVAMANVLDQAALSGAPIFRPAFTILFLGNEAISISENLAKLGILIPAQFVQYLKVMRDKALGLEKERPA
ncbi:MAG: phage holin family protein [Chloroflexi bacterium]|nr:phage holin family protein [Chloroflexota bacterium]